MLLTFHEVYFLCLLSNPFYIGLGWGLVAYQRFEYMPFLGFSYIVWLFPYTLML